MMFLSPMRFAYVTSLFMLLFIAMEPGGHGRVSMSVPNIMGTTVNSAMLGREPAGGDKRNTYI